MKGYIDEGSIRVNKFIFSKWETRYREQKNSCRTFLYPIRIVCCLLSRLIFRGTGYFYNYFQLRS